MKIESSSSGGGSGSSNSTCNASYLAGTCSKCCSVAVFEWLYNVSQW